MFFFEVSDAGRVGCFCLESPTSFPSCLAKSLHVKTLLGPKTLQKIRGVTPAKTPKRDM